MWWLHFRIAQVAALILLLGLLSCGGFDSTEPTINLPPSTQIAASGSLPRWSPDGQKLAYGGSGANAGIWIWEAQSGIATRIVDSGHPHNYDYRWSAGSDMIAFSGAGATIDSTSGIFTVNADGSNLVRHHPTGKYPDWIPDGSGLVFAEDDFQSGTQGLFRLDFSISQATRLTQTGYEPQVSPTGTLVAYRETYITYHPNGYIDTLQYRMNVSDLAGLPSSMIADSCLHFVWTSDGNYLIYDFTRSGLVSDPGSRICIISAGGGLPTKIVQKGAEPSVSAGDRLAHRQIDGEQDLGIYVINLDGSGFEQLSFTGAQPSIKPDGSQVAYCNGGGIWVVNP